VTLIVEMQFKGQIPEQWSEWFDGLAITHSGLDATILTGRLPDQSALYGIISRMRDLGLQLISLSSEEIKE